MRACDEEREAPCVRPVLEVGGGVVAKLAVRNIAQLTARCVI